MELPRSSRRTLDFDIETVAAGFADPQWVPNRTTCWAYTWVGTTKEAEASPVQSYHHSASIDPRPDSGSRTRGDSRLPVECDALPVADFYDKEARRRFLLPLLAAIEQADVLTGHNIIRFDLPILNAECLLLGLPLLGSVLVQDTIRLPRSKGFKKGQDNMSHALGVKEEKLPLDWAQWEEAYGDSALATLKERCASDVLMHVQMRDKMRERGWLSAPKMWRP